MAASPWSQEDADAFLQAYACDNPSGDSILHLAVRKDDLEVMRHLLVADFPENTRNDDGKTPLHLAAELGRVDASKLLVNYGADALARQRSPGDSDLDADSGMNFDAASAHSDDGTSTPPPRRQLKIFQRHKPPSPFDIAFDRGDERLVGLFVRDVLSMELDSREESTMLQFMANAFIMRWEDVLEAFREMAWNIDRVHSQTGHSFLYYVSQQAKDAGPVERLIKSGADATEADSNGVTVLHIAAQLGRCSDGSVVSCLIAAGAPVSAKDKIWGGIPLVAAIQGQKIANVCVLLEAGSDVNFTVRHDDTRRTLLHLAAQDGIPEMIQLLLEWGANPNALDELSTTPARWAICNNHFEAVRVLLKGGLDPNFDKGRSLRMAIDMGQLRITELFIQHGATVKRSMIELARADHTSNQVPLLELCVKNLANDDIDGANKDNSDDDLFDLSSGDDEIQVSIPKLMTNRGPDVYRRCAVLIEHGYGTGLSNLKDVPRALLICMCAEHGFMKAISRLLEVGKISRTIRQFTIRPFGWTALQVAAYKGNTFLVDELYSQGWSLAEEDNLGRSVLDIAAYWGHVELVQKLLATHCIAEHRDRDGFTPLHYAVLGSGHDDCCLLEYLMAAGCDVSKACASGETALHYAARLNHDTTAAWLLKMGCPASVTDEFISTPLHIAASFNSVPVIKTLLFHGAQLDRAALDGRTPLHCASQAGADDAVTALLDAGADPSKTDSREHTALAKAIYWGVCDLQTIDALFERTKVDWTATRITHLVVTATLAVKSPNRALTLSRVIEAMRAVTGDKKACRIVKRLLPELMPEILVCSDDSDHGSPADVISLLLDFLPENGKTRRTILFQMLLAVIKHGGDEDGQLTHRLLVLDKSNVSQAILGGWGLQHLCCRYGRLKQLRVVLGLGLSPFSGSVIDGVTWTPVDVARKFFPAILPQFESLIEGMRVLGQICRQDSTIFPMFRRVLRPEHFTREIMDLSDSFKRDFKGGNGQ